MNLDCCRSNCDADEKILLDTFPFIRLRLIVEYIVRFTCNA